MGFLLRWLLSLWSTWACRLRQLQQVDSAVVAPGLQRTGPVVVVHGLSCSKPCGIFRSRDQNCLLHWQANSLSLSHQGSPQVTSGELLDDSGSWTICQTEIIIYCSQLVLRVVIAVVKIIMKIKMGYSFYFKVYFVFSDYCNFHFLVISICIKYLFSSSRIQSICVWI